ncbi:MAG: GreA/GreB family elongation factor [Burkholderiales bacterium]|nr:GreA/GreB family elongation factor [Burkholderiales bacterium]MDE1928575.1 GreA/GreB family elongation factor [Burkholderiales bacterium]MDE2158592.1 GreA/GreB family elongation factor [Burkholderiales bacterium]
MTTRTSAGRLFNALDHARLSRLGSDALPATLRDLLDEHPLVAPQEVPGDLVTMGSQIELSCADAAVPQVVTLRYPADAAPAAGSISILAPMGASLLGIRVGDTAQWSLPGGRTLRARVDRILYQPESQGDFLT